MHMTIRRAVLKHLACIGTVSAGAMLMPTRVLAQWPSQAFRAKTLDDAIQAALGSSSARASDAIRITAPEVAEDDGQPGITVRTSLPSVTAIGIFVAKNPSPLACSFRLGGDVEPTVAARIKMMKSSDVIVVVQSEGRLYRASRFVKLTKGGCGG